MNAIPPRPGMIRTAILVPLLFFGWFCSNFSVTASDLTNNRYSLSLLPNHSVEIQVPGLPSQYLGAEFTVMYSGRDPGFSMNRVGRFDRGLPRPFPRLPAFAQRWTFYSDDASDPTEELKSAGVKDLLSVSVNSRGERIVSYLNIAGKRVDRKEEGLFKGTVRPYLAGERTVLKAVSSVMEGRSIKWRFAGYSSFALAAELHLPSEGDPVIRFQLTPQTAGFFSVAYTGAPWTQTDKLLPVPQETMDPGRGIFDYLISEAHMSLPRIHIATADFNAALVVDPAESPFRLVEDSKAVWTYAYPDESNSRYGLMTEASGDRIRPVVFAPIMGGSESHMPPASKYTFALRYVLRSGSWQDTYKYIACDIYRFRDMRDNGGTGPMTRTLENMMDYLSERDTNNYSMWHAEQKYHNYWSDQSGIFKPFSPLFALSAAIITDDESYYRTRALPMIEFALSRKNNVFSPYDVHASGMVSTLEAPLGGPYVDAGQLDSMNGMFQHRTYAFKYYAEGQGPGRNTSMYALGRYRATGQAKFLEQAEKAANLSGGSFMDMLELYEETGKHKYLQAAMQGAYRYLAVINLFPVVPDRNVTVDAGSLAPVHGHAFQRHEDWGFALPKAVWTAEQNVPAWRASLIGTELSAYRGGYWLNNHGQLMRLATLSNDDFLRDLQRWAMVGRFGNHAGDFRSNRHSLIGERPDAPMHPIYELTYSTFNPGHACEWVGATIDFMVSDLFNRSGRQIDFPSRCMYESSFRVKVYGDRPGRFYDEKNVRLWLPRGLLKADNPQADYIGAHGNGKFYVAFWNQSFRPEKVNVSVNSAVVEFAKPHRARVWVNNADKGVTEVTGNRLEFELPPKGIAAFAIEGAKVKTKLHTGLFADDCIWLGQESVVETNAAFGRVVGMLLSPGKGLTTSYVYTDAPAAKVILAKFRHRQEGGLWTESTDEIYPYEFSTNVDENSGPFEFLLELETAGHRIESTGVLRLAWGRNAK